MIFNKHSLRINWGTKINKNKLALQKWYFNKFILDGKKYKKAFFVVNVPLRNVDWKVMPGVYHSFEFHVDWDFTY